MVLDSWSMSPAVDGNDNPARWLGCGAVGSGDDVGLGLNLPVGDPRRGDRHQGRVNVAFVDGHVKSIGVKDLASRVLNVTATNGVTRYSQFLDYDESSGGTSCAGWMVAK